MFFCDKIRDIIKASVSVCVSASLSGWFTTTRRASSPNHRLISNHCGAENPSIIWKSPQRTSFSPLLHSGSSVIISSKTSCQREDCTVNHSLVLHSTLHSYSFSNLWLSHLTIPAAKSIENNTHTHTPVEALHRPSTSSRWESGHRWGQSQ